MLRSPVRQTVFRASVALQVGAHGGATNGGVLSNFAIPYGDRGKTWVAPLERDEDGKIKKRLRVQFYPKRFSPDGEFPEHYFYGKYCNSSDWERLWLEQPTIALAISVVVWILLYWIILFLMSNDDPPFERSAAKIGLAVDRETSYQMGILRHLQTRWRYQWDYRNAQPTQWYGEGYKGAPQVGSLQIIW